QAGMSLDHILLGILREPSAGYDIKRQFQEVFNHFWSADLAQIYRSLQRLEKQGLLESRVEPSDRGPPRKVYRRTPAGGRQLQEWLAGGPVFGTEKVPWLAEVFSLAQGTERVLEDRVSIAFSGELEAGLAAVEAFEAGWGKQRADLPDGVDDMDLRAWLTVDMGLRKTRAQVGWADKPVERRRKRT